MQRRGVQFNPDPPPAHPATERSRDERRLGEGVIKAVAVERSCEQRLGRSAHEGSDDGVADLLGRLGDVVAVSISTARKHSRA